MENGDSDKEPTVDRDPKRQENLLRRPTNSFLGTGHKFGGLVGTSDSIQKFLEATRPFSDLLRTSDSLQDMFVANRPLSDLLRTSGSLQALQEAARPLVNLLHNSDSVRGMIRATRSFSDLFSEVKELKYNWSIDDEGVITAGSRSLTTTELEQIIEQVTERTKDYATDVIDKNLQNLVNEIRALKDPFIIKILLHLALPLIMVFVAAILNPIADFYIKENLTTNYKRFAKKQINRLSVAAIPQKSQLNTFRFVKVKVLIIRSNSSIRAQRVGQLYFGQVVELIQKKRKWSLVKWNDDEKNIVIIGWALSRYLEKFQSTY